jgi:hypothetical protein
VSFQFLKRFPQSCTDKTKHGVSFIEDFSIKLIGKQIKKRRHGGSFMKIVKLKKVFLIALALIAVACSFLQVNATEAKPKILVLTYDWYYGPPDSFITGASTYGETVKMHLSAANSYSLDYLRQFDVFVTVGSWKLSKYSGSDWSDYPDLAGKIGTLVDEGKSLIVLYTAKGGAPTDAWVYSYGFNTPSDVVEYEIVPCALTQGVRGIKGGGVDLFLSGGYPLVLSPKKPGYPDPQGALAVYGFYGNGKYAALSYGLYYMEGDFGTLFSNIMHWLAGRDIPPPPSVYDLGQKVAELNSTLDHLNSKLLELNNSINQLYNEIPQLGNISEQLAQAVQETNALSQQVNDLANEIVQLKNQQQPQNLSTYLAIPAILLSITAIIVALKRKQTPAQIK